MANSISKTIQQILVPSSPVTVTTSTPGSVKLSLKSSREPAVYSYLSIAPKSGASGSSYTNTYLDLTQPKSILEDVWEGVEPGTYTVFARGTAKFLDSTNTEPGATFPMTVPESWIDTVTTPAKTTTITYTPPPVLVDAPTASWDSGGTSSPVFSDDGEVSFRIKGDNVQSVAGLNESLGAESVTYTDINFAIYANRGEYRVMENGGYSTAAQPFTEEQVFKISRIGGLVKYYVDDALIHSSLQVSTADLILDASLYYGGDTILDGELIDLESLSVIAPSPQVLAGSSELEHKVIQTGNGALGWGTFYGLSDMDLTRTSIYATETLSGEASASATGRELEGQNNSHTLPLTGISSDVPYGAGTGAMLPATSSAAAGLINVGVGIGNALMHPALSQATGLTGGNNLDTTASMQAITGLSSDRDLAQGIGSMSEMTGFATNYTTPQARPEVTIYTTLAQGSGTLLHTGRHILTAAHVLDGSQHLTANYSLVFFDAIENGFTPPAITGITFHPDWDGDFRNGNDIAIIELEEYIPWARGIEPSQSLDSIDRDWDALSYSPRVHPVTGSVSTAGWDAYANTYDDNEVAINARLPGTFNVPVDSMLAYDYDNGLAANDAFDVVLGIPGLGIDNEGIATPGDSGSARVIDGKIVGISSYSGSTGSSADINTASNGTYGDFGFDVRVSYYLDFIEETVGSLTFATSPDNTVPGQADVAITGFNTFIYSIGKANFNTASLSGFDTEVTLYGGSVAAVGSMTTSIESTVNNPVYGVVNLGSFTSSMTSTSPTGSIASADVHMRLGKTVVAYTGASCTIGSFSSTITAKGINGLVGRATLEGFSTSLTSIVSTPYLAQANIAMPSVTSVYGIARPGGFSTQIIASNTLVVNNVVAYSVNVTSNETTIYTPYEFDSILRIFNKYYGVKSTGLYLLEGVDDDGVNIDVKIKTSMMDFGTALHKRVPYMYMDSDNDTLITPFIDDVPSEQHQSGFAGRRTKLGRGNSGRFWGFEVVNVEGNEFKLGSLEAYAQTLNRKV